MECPKCLGTCVDEAAECPRCGVVFAKLASRHPLAEPVDRSLPVEHSPHLVLSSSDPLAGIARLGRGALLLILVWWTWEFARAPMGARAMDSVLHLPNLVFHEAGT